MGVKPLQEYLTIRIEHFENEINQLERENEKLKNKCNNSS